MHTSYTQGLSLTAIGVTRSGLAMKTTPSLPYESLHAINQAFGAIVQQLGNLHEWKLLTAEYIGHKIALLEEERAGINHMITEILNHLEENNWTAFQNVRLKYERKWKAKEAKLDKAAEKKRKK